MNIVTMVGDTQTGKTALCEQWSSPEDKTDSYLSTISVRHYLFPSVTLNDTPSDRRFHFRLESYYASTDVFVLVANEDANYDEWYSRIHPIAPEASWLLIWTGKDSCPRKREWASSNNIPMIYTHLKDPEQVKNAFMHMVQVSSKHAPRHERVPLGMVESIVDEARRWWPCV
jgi:GTPase SAR1 family protein